MKNFAGMSTLDVWYAGNDAIRKRRRTYVDGIGRRTIRKAYDDMTEAAGASRRFVDEPPLVYHWSGHDAEFFDVDAIRGVSPVDGLVDWVVKVVGVGSVGTRCAAALFLADEDDPLILQPKRSRAVGIRRLLEPESVFQSRRTGRRGSTYDAGASALLRATTTRYERRARSKRWATRIRRSSHAFAVGLSPARTRVAVTPADCRLSRKRRSLRKGDRSIRERVRGYRGKRS